MIIKKATIQDAKSIGKVHVDSWRTTYKHIVPAEYLSKLSYEQKTQLWTKQIADKTKYVLVAENELGDIIGFTSASKRDSNSTPHFSYVETLYLLEDYHGRGIGKKLLKEITCLFVE